MRHISACSCFLILPYPIPCTRTHTFLPFLVLTRQYCLKFCSYFSSHSKWTPLERRKSNLVDFLPQVTSSTLRVYPNRCQHFPPFKLNCIFALSVHFSWYATHLSVFNCLFPLVNFKLIVFLQWRGHCMVISWNTLSCISRLIRVRWSFSPICVMTEVSVVVEDFKFTAPRPPFWVLGKAPHFQVKCRSENIIHLLLQENALSFPHYPPVSVSSVISVPWTPKVTPCFSRIPVNCEVYLQYPRLRHLQASARRRRNTISSPDSALQTE